MNTNIKRVMMLMAMAGLTAGTYAEDKEPVFEIKGVEVSGYLDMSVVSVNGEEGAASDDGGDSLSAGLDRAEVRFASELADGVYIEAHVAGGSDEDFDLEQAFVSYSAISNVTITGGKFLSSLGWEAFHAPDLFQYSTSATLVYPGMQNGVGAAYSTDMFTVYGAALSGVWSSTDTDAQNPGYEGHVRFTGVEDFTLFVGAATEEYDTYDQTLVNIWASYVIGNLTLAAEVNMMNEWGIFDATGSFLETGDGFGWLLMANYGITDKLGITLRTSALDVEGDTLGDTTEDMKFTIAPSYVLTDNVSFVLEFNTIEDINGDTTQTTAFETIVTF